MAVLVPTFNWPSGAGPSSQGMLVPQTGIIPYTGLMVRTPLPAPALGGGGAPAAPIGYPI